MTTTKIKWTKSLMEAWAFMGRIIKNYIKMKKVESEGK